MKLSRNSGLGRNRRMIGQYRIPLSLTLALSLWERARVREKSWYDFGFTDNLETVSHINPLSIKPKSVDVNRLKLSYYCLRNMRPSGGCLVHDILGLLTSSLSGEQPEAQAAV